MSEKMDSLVEIPRGDWIKLRDLYDKQDPSSHGYMCINNYINWVKKEPELPIRILSLNGDWQKEGTFLISVEMGHKYHLFFNTLNDDLSPVTKALECLKPTNDQYLFFGYRSRFDPVIRHIGKTFLTKELSFTDGVWYYATKELVSTFTIEVPNGIRLDNLSIKDAETINEIWPHRHPNSVEFVRRQIQYSENVGAYDETGKLVSWCLRLPVGSLGLLQVLESHKRLGLGSLMVRALSKKINDLGESVVAPVVPENIASRTMFEKLGFRNIDKVYWAE
ncbi:uncharacterized protein LOC117900992 [Drosophila subobscura]|uniref:uncharacterized protein LOC117900992 n=1 Tax=Drosophila subobscura TaxID=7241 RepID=UPI00155A1666|nr:uncharacterized protein LOC117900992 [Drosophila subobscura]